MPTSNATEQCSPAMARTDVRNGRTQNLLTSQRNSPFVTRGRTYGEVWS